MLEVGGWKEGVLDEPAGIESSRVESSLTALNWFGLGWVRLGSLVVASRAIQTFTVLSGHSGRVAFQRQT